MLHHVWGYSVECQNIREVLSSRTPNHCAEKRRFISKSIYCYIVYVVRERYKLLFVYTCNQNSYAEIVNDL